MKRKASQPEWEIVHPESVNASIIPHLELVQRPREDALGQAQGLAVRAPRARERRRRRLDLAQRLLLHQETQTQG